MSHRIATLITILAGASVLAGCAGKTFKPGYSGYLSHYHHLEQVDETTSRYVDAPRLSSYNKFKISSVQILTKNYNGKPITPEQQQKMADFIRSSITSALQDRYPVVDSPSTDTAELRVAITDIYKSAAQVGITVEGEILDSFSAVQVGAVIRNDLGDQYLGDWWDKPSAREIVNNWSMRLRQAIDSAHQKQSSAKP